MSSPASPPLVPVLQFLEDMVRLSVLLHAQKLREFNVSASDVVNALRAQNTNAPVGRVKGDLDEQLIRLVGRIERPAEFNDIVIKRVGNEIVRLGQVATVEDGFAEPGSYSLRSGSPNVGLSVIRQREASTVTVAERIRDEVKKINETTFEVERSLVRDLVSGTAKTGGARIAPVTKDGKLDGLRLIGVRAGTPAAALGFKNRDVLEAINGTKIESANNLLDFYAQMEKLSSVQLEGTRDGKPLKIELRLR